MREEIIPPMRASPDKAYATDIDFCSFCFIFFYNLSIFDESKISRKIFVFIYQNSRHHFCGYRFDAEYFPALTIW